MTLHVNHNDKRFPVRFKKFDKETSSLCCECDAESPENFEIPYVLPIRDTYDPSDFEVYFFFKNAVKENEIYQVYDRAREARIGWCFPIQALASKEHSYCDNEHFLKYAYVATVALLDRCPDYMFTISPSIDSSGKINLNDFFHDATVVLVICKSTLEKGTSFDLANWLPSFFSLGYTQLLERSPCDLFYKIENVPVEKRVNVQQTSSILKNEKFIEFVFSERLPYEKNPLLCFFYLYQIVELLIEKIFQAEQKKLVDELVKVTGDSFKTKEVLEKYKDCISEKKRLDLLVTNYVDNMPSEDDLKKSCNNFLKSAGVDDGGRLSQYFYPVRNILFHNFHNSPPNIDSLLSEIIQSLIPFLCDLLIVFSVNDSKSAGLHIIDGDIK